MKMKVLLRGLVTVGVLRLWKDSPTCPEVSTPAVSVKIRSEVLCVVQGTSLRYTRTHSLARRWVSLDLTRECREWEGFNRFGGSIVYLRHSSFCQ